MYLISSTDNHSYSETIKANNLNPEECILFPPGLKARQMIIKMIKKKNIKIDHILGPFSLEELNELGVLY